MTKHQCPFCVCIYSLPWYVNSKISTHLMSFVRLCTFVKTRVYVCVFIQDLYRVSLILSLTRSNNCRRNMCCRTSCGRNLFNGNVISDIGVKFNTTGLRVTELMAFSHCLLRMTVHLFYVSMSVVYSMSLWRLRFFDNLWWGLGTSKDKTNDSWIFNRLEY